MTAPTEDRPRCSDGDRRKRTELVGVRFTPDELDLARRLAAQHDLSVPELLRTGLTFLAVFACNCGGTFDADDGVCPNYPTSCRGCVACRTDDDHDPPCVCDCEETA